MHSIMRSPFHTTHHITAYKNIKGSLYEKQNHKQNPKQTMLRPWIPLDKLDWFYLSSNPGAIDLLKNHPQKINWKQLSQNPAAIDLLKQNPDKIDWYYLSLNPGAIDLLDQWRRWG